MKRTFTSVALLIFCIVNAQNIDYKWFAQIGSPLEDIGNGLAVINDGSVLIAGHFMGTADFDPGIGVDARASNGARDAFVQKLDSNGSVVWAYAFGGAQDDFAHDVATDNTGNAFVAGTFNGTVDFDPSSAVVSKTSAGGTDGYLLKINANGTFAWVITFGGSSLDEAVAVTVDNNGNPTVMGNFIGTVDFDPGAAQLSKTSLGARDNYIVKLDSGGNLIWAQAFGGVFNEFTTTIAVDGQGGIVAAGIFSDQVDFDPGAGTNNITSQGTFDAYFVKLSGAGNFEWVTTFGGVGVDHAYDVASDGKGNWFVGGSFENTVSFGSANTFTSKGMADAYVAKLDGTGAVLWAHSIGVTANSGNSNDAASCVVAHPDGGAIFSGFTNGNWDFDNNPQQSPNFGPFGGVYNLKLSGSGAFEWAVPLDDVNEVSETEINSKGEYYMTGWFTSKVDFDFSTDSAFFEPVGSSDMFMVKYKTQVPNTTDMDEVQNGLTIYPNPAGKMVYFNQDLQNSFTLLKVYSSNGQMLESVRLEELSNPSLQMPQMAGLYFFEFSNHSGEREVLKIVKE